MWVQSLGWEDALAEGMATCSSILAWRIPWTKKPVRLYSIESQRVRHNCSNLACVHVLGIISGSRNKKEKNTTAFSF